MLTRTAFAASLLGVLAVTGSAIAGNGAGSNKAPSSWISPPVVVSSSNLSVAGATSGPRSGDRSRFEISTSQSSSPFVNLRCYQDGALVLNSWSAFFDGGLGDGTFGLGSPAWQSGAADCKADLGMYSAHSRWRVLASTSFRADA